MALRPVNGLALCAGAGGLELGLATAIPGYRTVCYVERELAAAAVLAARMEDGSLAPALIWDDVATFDGRAWRGVVDIVSAGFPCQPFSVAGKRRGIEDERWIWGDIARVIREVGPSIVFLENVRGILAGHGGLDILFADLADMGFDAEWCVLPASAAGAPHRRERVFILAYSRHTERPGRDDKEGRAEGEACAEPAPCSGDLDDTICERSEGGVPGRSTDAQGWEEPDELAGQSGGVFPPGPGELDRWRAILARHPELAPATEPAVRGMADGMASQLGLTRAQKLRMLGNGVVPQQAALAWRILKALVEG